MTFIKFLFTKAFLRQLLIAILAIIVLVFVIMQWLATTTNHDQKISVPNLSKMSLEEVEDKLNEIDLRYVILDSSNYNPDFPKYSVIEQLPKTGEYVKENRKIYLTLNRSGYPYIVIPEVLGRTRRQAVPTLIAMGFQVGKITYRPYIAKDEVLEMLHNGKTLIPGDELQQTEIIDLVLGDGEGNLERDVKVKQ